MIGSLFFSDASLMFSKANIGSYQFAFRSFVLQHGDRQFSGKKITGLIFVYLFKCNIINFFKLQKMLPLRINFPSSGVAEPVSSFDLSEECSRPR